MMPPAPRFLVVADVGGDDRRHIGDEAMLEANLAGLRALYPAATFCLVARDAPAVAARYGMEAVSTFRFAAAPGEDAARRAHHARVLADAAAGRFPDPAAAALARADALVVSGGGNLCSLWPDLLAERALLLALAHSLRKPAIVLGQTLGPQLSSSDRALLADVLPGVRHFGAREMPSAALALALGVPAARIVHQTDDALCADAPLADGLADDAPVVAVTLDAKLRSLAPALFDALAAQLHDFAQGVGARVLFVPHAWGEDADAPGSDLREARELAARLAPAPVQIARVRDAAQARALAAAAALIVSSRYHPLVFGLAAGVPVLALHGDEYCRIKLDGALRHARMERASLGFSELGEGGLQRRLLDTWARRAAVRAHLFAQRARWQRDADARWQRVRHALENAGTPPADATQRFAQPLADVADDLCAALEAQREGWQREHVLHAQALQHLAQELGPRRTLQRYAHELLRRIMSAFAK